jgi:DNA end-binding protein Ku
MHVPSGREANAKEQRMARQLLSMLEGSFDPREYRDEYRERVLDLVRKKAAGKKIELRAPEKKRPARDLHDALEKSLAAVAGGARAKKQAKERTHG